MNKPETVERELELGVSSVIELMNRLYSVRGLGLEEEQQRRLSDVRFGNDLTGIMKMIARLRKLCEYQRDASLQVAGYEMRISIDCDRVSYEIKYSTGVKEEK